MLKQILLLSKHNANDLQRSQSIERRILVPDLLHSVHSSKTTVLKLSFKIIEYINSLNMKLLLSPKLKLYTYTIVIVVNNQWQFLLRQSTEIKHCCSAFYFFTSLNTCINALNTSSPHLCRVCKTCLGLPSDVVHDYVNDLSPTRNRSSSDSDLNLNSDSQPLNSNATRGLSFRVTISEQISTEKATVLTRILLVAIAVLTFPAATCFAVYKFLCIIIVPDYRKKTLDNSVVLKCNFDKIH